MPKSPTKTKERNEIKILIIRHLEAKEQENELNRLVDDSWELTAVDNGIAYLQRFATN